jgi:F-type H+-transporting ATPase subunit gamma
MTDRLADIEGRVHSVQQLGNVVTAMRGIAATRAQQSRGLLPAIDAYSRMIAEAITQALPLVPADGPAPKRGSSSGTPPGTLRAALVLFGAEQGFAGAFGDRMLAATDHLPPGTALFLIGSRTARQVEERGMRPAWRTAMAAHTGAITALATRIAEALYAALPDANFGQVEMVFPIWRPGAELQVERRSLLPLDPRWFPPRPLGQAPLITLPPARLLEQLAEEYVTAQLCEAATHAFAAENEARAAAMMRAKNNIAGMLETLRAEERRVRQEAITAEVVELASGSGMF